MSFNPWISKHEDQCPGRSRISIQDFDKLPEKWHGANTVKRGEAVYINRAYPQFLLLIINIYHDSPQTDIVIAASILSKETERAMLARIPERRCHACVSQDALEILEGMQNSGIFSRDNESTCLWIYFPSHFRTTSRDNPKEGDDHTIAQMEALSQAFDRERGHNWKVSVQLYYTIGWEYIQIQARFINEPTVLDGGPRR